MGQMSKCLFLYSSAVLLVLAIIASTLEGGNPLTNPAQSLTYSGLTLFLAPDLSKLLEPKVWYEAISQSLFSMGIGNGSIFKMGSENHFKRNIYRSVFVIALVDTLVSLVAGKIISQICNFHAYQKRDHFQDHCRLLVLIDFCPV